MIPWRIREQEDNLLCASCFLVSKDCCMSASVTKIQPSYPALKMNGSISMRLCLSAKKNTKFPISSEIFYLSSVTLSIPL